MKVPLDQASAITSHLCNNRQQTLLQKTDNSVISKYQLLMPTSMKTLIKKLSGHGISIPLGIYLSFQMQPGHLHSPPKSAL